MFQRLQWYFLSKNSLILFIPLKNSSDWVLNTDYQITIFFKLKKEQNTHKHKQATEIPWHQIPFWTQGYPLGRHGHRNVYTRHLPVCICHDPHAVPEQSSWHRFQTGRGLPHRFPKRRRNYNKLDTFIYWELHF